jgi:hypothetical protein
MTLYETLNEIHLAGPTDGLTFFPSPDEDDLDADVARLTVAQFIDDCFVDLLRDDGFVAAAQYLCAYGAALFAAIDSHGADDGDHDPNG